MSGKWPYLTSDPESVHDLQQGDGSRGISKRVLFEAAAIVIAHGGDARGVSNTDDVIEEAMRLSPPFQKVLLAERMCRAEA